MTLRITGLAGGHSGAEIDKGRANANMLLGRLLLARPADETDLRVDLRLPAVCKDNAIPTRRPRCPGSRRRCRRAGRLPPNGLTASSKRSTGSTTRPSPSPWRPARNPTWLPTGRKLQPQRACACCTCLPNGIQAMSADMPGLVQTSLNLGILTTEGRRRQRFLQRPQQRGQPEADAASSAFAA